MYKKRLYEKNCKEIIKKRYTISRDNSCDANEGKEICYRE